MHLLRALLRRLRDAAALLGGEILLEPDVHPGLRDRREALTDLQLRVRARLDADAGTLALLEPAVA